MLQRQLVFTDTKLKKGIPINIVHFNVLADHLCRDFNGTEEEGMKWEVRRERLLGLIKKETPTILSLVEVDHYVDFWIPSMLTLDLIPVAYAQKEQKNHGVVLFYNPSVLSIKSVQCSVREVAAIICRFNEDITVVNTHLKAKGMVDERRKQIDVIRTYMYTPSKHLILVGDLNTTVEEDAVQSMSRHFHLKHVAPLEWTTWKSRPSTNWQNGGEVRRAIDHFFTGHPEHVLSYLGVPSDEDVKKNDLLPGKQYPSDHLLIKMTYLLD
jgi:endonuclease/exonuclease/phosphatase family metal-dependent hydrolase